MEYAANLVRFSKYIALSMLSGLVFALIIETAWAQNSVRDIYHRANPSVVVIHTVEKGRLKSDPEVTATEIGLGSGVVVSKDGLVLTASHVVHNSDAVEVKFLDGTISDAIVLGTVQWVDIAILRIKNPPANMVVAELGDSSKVHIGDQVIVIGAPRNLEHTLTVGHISGKRSSEKYSDPALAPEFLQTDAAINVGNSGGPMFDMEGKVIGIISQFISHSGGSEGIGLTVGINVAYKLLFEQPRIWTGLEFYFLTGELAKALNVPQASGLLVQRVAKDSPGHISGFRPGKLYITVKGQEIFIGGDIVLDIGEHKIDGGIAEMEEIIRQSDLARPITFKVLRDGRIEQIVFRRSEFIN